jgi:hypothetical protein
MAENIKLFRQGGMNTDDAVEFIQQNDYVDAYNVRVTGTSESEEGLATNPESNALITNTLPTGLNKTIGAAGFEVTRTAYSFIYNSQQYNVIAKLNYDNNTQENIFTNLTDSGDKDILPLDPEYYVNDIKLINDYLLAWTDGKNQPCITNLTRLEAGGYGPLEQDDFLIIKAQPMTPPLVEYRSDSTRGSNLLKERLFQFMYQYIYLDDEYSSFSIISKREVPEDEDTQAVGSVVTKNNVLIVHVNIGTNRAKSLNVIARIGNQDFFSIKSITRAAILALPNLVISFEGEIREVYDPVTNIYSFCFYNDGLYINEDPLITDIPYDFVPLKCETLENVNGNLLALGGLTEGYPRPETDVLIESVTYNPNVAKVPENPLGALRVANWVQVVVNDSIFKPNFRRTTVYYRGVAKTGDKFKIVVSDLDGNLYPGSDYIYTVKDTENNNTLAAVTSFGVSLLFPFSVSVSGDEVILTYSTRRSNETPSGKKEQTLSVSVELFGAGTGELVSRPTLKSNSSYQAFLWYKDRWGRYFPICTDDRYIIKTPSYSQIEGLASMITWQINHNPPADAAYYGWGLSKNTTHQTTLWVQGEIDYTRTDANYFTFNINSLLKFNEKNSSSVLNYEYSPGDRCTFVYYNIGDDTTVKNWFNKIDVEVVDFTIDVTTDEPPVTNYYLKVQKPADVDPLVLGNNNALLEIYTPKKRVTTVNGQQEYAEQLFYEIGLSYPIIDGAHSVTSGTIKTGDVYIKTRQMANAVDLTQTDLIVVEDFNFSDFYASEFYSYGKPRTYNDELGRIERRGSIRYSDVFQRGSIVNGLVKFYPENIYGDGDGETSSNYGWIRKIRQRNNVLVVLQELKVGYVPVFQSVLEDQQATAQYAISVRLFNFVRYNGKNIGMGNAKESYAEWNNNIYFVDPFRSEPIRAGLDGVDTISGKMSKYFKKTLQEVYESGKKIIGYYDIFYNEYLLTNETSGDVLVSIPFNTVSWQLDDTYVIPASGISLVTNGTKGVAVYNSTTGIATYTPDFGETGADNFTFTFTPSGGSATTKKVCLTIEEGNSNPNLFDLNTIMGANYSTLYESNPVLIIGNNIPAPISISGSGQYRINEEAWTNTSGFVNPDSNVSVRLTSSAIENTTLSTTLTVGSVSSTFSVTTKDETPTAFVFTDVTEAEISTMYSSNIVTITGITGLVDISIVGGEYRINGGTWVSTAGTITNSQTAQVRRTSSASYDTSVGTTLTVGTYSDTYSILTREALPVTVNYSLTKDADPHVDLILVPVVNGINIGNIFATSTGVISPVFEGDSVTIAIAHSVTGYPWPTGSSASLVIEADSTEIYNSGLKTDPLEPDLASYSFTAVGGVVYDAVALSNSDSTDYIASLFSMDNSSSAPLTTNSSFPVVDFRFIDNTDAEFVLYTAQFSQPQNNNGFNWLDDANTGKLVINNNSIYDLDFTLTNVPLGGAYNTTITVVNGMSGEFNAIPKTSYNISYINTPDAVYSNIEISESFQKDDCTEGSSGTYVTYTVPADTYTSLISQLDADNQAEADILANGQDYANTNATCLVDTINAIISVDMFNDATLDVCAYIDTAGVSESNVIAARDGLNFYLETDPAPSAYILASDNIDQTTLKRRFLFNIGKLIAQYPDDVAIPTFVFKIRGRSATAGTKTGLWQREFADTSMTMTGEPGTYIPTTIPSGGPPASSWSAEVIGGGDGTVGISVGAVILTFTYTRATNAIALVTA